MAKSMLIICSRVRYCLLIIALVLYSNIVTVAEAIGEPRVFNVMKYGAFADGKTDSSKAFLKAWKEACEYEGRARVFVPKGKYMLYPVDFFGPCKGHMTFLIKQSTLIAPTQAKVKFSEKWISFREIDGLRVAGGGTLNGQGATSWPLNDCQKNPNCHLPPTSVRFDFIKNARIQNLRSIDSKSTHFLVHGCENLNLTKIRISAPAESPNTDGIKIGNSRGIRISQSAIGTGDDCVSILSGSSDVHIAGVLCGSGHGISVGSLGKYRGEADVRGLFVSNCTFRSTTNGLRIKTWGSPFASKAHGFLFQDIAMEDVFNPIVIDQQYCPNSHCNDKISSSVEISNVKLKNIHGSSSSEVAVSLRCSPSTPCKGVVLGNINLVHNSPQGASGTSFCSNMSMAYRSANKALLRASNLIGNFS